MTVEAVGLNYSDVLRGNDRRSVPYVPGAEIAGTIETVGAGVQLRAGMPVAALLPARGGCADVVAVPADQLLDRGSLPAEQVAGSLLTFLTAMLAIEGCGLLAGQVALVHAAGGGVGTAALQLLRQAGIASVGLASGSRKRRIVAQLGAAEVHDPTDPDVLERLLSDHPDGFDGILDGVGGERAWAIDVGVAARQATIAVYGFAGGDRVCLDIHEHLVRKGLRVFGFAATDATLLPQRLDRLRSDLIPSLESGRVWPVIEEILPVSELGSGLQRLAAGDVVGKLVVRL